MNAAVGGKTGGKERRVIDRGEVFQRLSQGRGLFSEGIGMGRNALDACKERAEQPIMWRVRKALPGHQSYDHLWGKKNSQRLEKNALPDIKRKKAFSAGPRVSAADQRAWSREKRVKTRGGEMSPSRRGEKARGQSKRMPKKKKGGTIIIPAGNPP